MGLSIPMVLGGRSSISVSSVSEWYSDGISLVGPDVVCTKCFIKFYNVCLIILTYIL